MSMNSFVIIQRFWHRHAIIFRVSPVSFLLPKNRSLKQESFRRSRFYNSVVSRLHHSSELSPNLLILIPFRSFSKVFNVALFSRRHFSSSTTTVNTSGHLNQSRQNRRTTFQSHYQAKNRSLLLYTVALLVFGLGFTYAAVPLYRMFCQITGFVGTPNTDTSKFSPDRLVPMTNSRRIRITFNADTSVALQWKFMPQQREVYVLPGETALAFYTAKNLSDQDIIGIATYNVTPMKVGQYFNKIQCFCFEEQKLRAGEQVDMPVFFFLDPEIDNDPLMRDVETVTLSYTFFKARYDNNGNLVPTSM
ncbi:hypothetical protein G9A89_016210 [Geosiphon pyriformis]|nr:hypothetical protein G9A89_016210 [Geosiphon pyriformis]